MCTVTYLPVGESTIVTANRDEAPSRNSDGLSAHINLMGEEFLIAREPLHGGTNLAIGKLFTTILLNGAFRPHERKKRYRKSRGIIVLESLNLSSFRAIEKPYLEGVEPFTLLRFGKVIEEVRWDESEVYFQEYPIAKPLILASAKLYSAQVLEKRANWYHEFLRSAPRNRQTVWDFHILGGDGDPENDMVMNRNDQVRTVSVTQIVTSPTINEAKHLDLIRGKTEEVKLGL